MAAPRVPAESLQPLSTSALLSADPQTAATSSLRPRRNRRLGNSREEDGLRSSPAPACDVASSYDDLAGDEPSRPKAYTRSGVGTGNIFGQSQGTNVGTLGQFLGDSWSQSWSSVQGLASTLLSSGAVTPQKTSTFQPSPPQYRATGQVHSRDRRYSRNGSISKSTGSWGPAPPSRNPTLTDLAAGSLAGRESAWKAAQTASILEGHDGVNGRLDAAGRHKRRNSDDATLAMSVPENCLVYVHRVQTDDTYAGLIVRYKCREDAFRRSNGLWSRDTIQTRKWLTIPVDACEVRCRPCEAPPSQSTQPDDFLASISTSTGRPPVDRLHAGPSGGPSRCTESEQAQDGDKWWTHVRWVRIESLQQPIEVGRVASRSLGYFPPRRKSSIKALSPLSTPRQSVDLSIQPLDSAERERPLFRKGSLSGGQPHSPVTPVSPRGHTADDSADSRPAWMRRPGGVGSMGRNIRTPGPAKDYLNSWTRKHIPSLNIDGLPSMSVMGAETARFGFSSDVSGIVESSYKDGQDAAIYTSSQGGGLDRMAAAFEGWLRGALTKRPTTPLNGARAWPGGLPARERHDSDVIELTDTGSEDGRHIIRGASATSKVP
ncbi:hypothetical protein DCS_00817 [Drechmeria coniospora]|uniref:LysM domain-containing protein n=1 Tax=Drechmeria coniospora TaxID=98403 RepID=A0A151GRG5_DRECN|nr:hypothetical protein DCS_00817 [Drechmeria coniospora]KYK59683.1 hypothetical protein DCS_00817 [Drechmeria coniospora]